MDNRQAGSDAPSDFRPNAAEKALGYIGAVTVAPFLFPMLPIMAFVRWSSASAQRPIVRVAKRVLMPVAATLVFVGFLVVCVVALPYGLLFGTLRLLGIVRVPPRAEEEEFTANGDVPPN